jgi:hypothetical protein
MVEYMLLQYCPHVEQRIRDLPEQATPHRIHHHFEHVLIGAHRLL